MSHLPDDVVCHGLDIVLDSGCSPLWPGVGDAGVDVIVEDIGSSLRMILVVLDLVIIVVVVFLLCTCQYLMVVVVLQLSVLYDQFHGLTSSPPPLITLK